MTGAARKKSSLGKGADLPELTQLYICRLRKKPIERRSQEKSLSEIFMISREIVGINVHDKSDIFRGGESVEDLMNMAGECARTGVSEKELEAM